MLSNEWTYHMRVIMRTIVDGNKHGAKFYFIQRSKQSSTTKPPIRTHTHLKWNDWNDGFRENSNMYWTQLNTVLPFSAHISCPVSILIVMNGISERISYTLSIDIGIHTDEKHSSM